MFKRSFVLRSGCVATLLFSSGCLRSSPRVHVVLDYAGKSYSGDVTFPDARDPIGSAIVSTGCLEARYTCRSLPEESEVSGELDGGDLPFADAILDKKNSYVIYFDRLPSDLTERGFINAVADRSHLGKPVACNRTTLPCTVTVTEIRPE